MIRLVEFQEKVSKSVEPCFDSQPAQGFPACKAVNFITLEEVLIPD